MTIPSPGLELEVLVIRTVAFLGLLQGVERSAEIIAAPATIDDSKVRHLSREIILTLVYRQLTKILGENGQHIGKRNHLHIGRFQTCHSPCATFGVVGARYIVPGKHAWRDAAYRPRSPVENAFVVTAFLP
jgi:hypothetical protein